MTKRLTDASETWHTTLAAEIESAIGEHRTDHPLDPDTFAHQQLQEAYVLHSMLRARLLNISEEEGLHGRTAAICGDMEHRIGLDEDTFVEAILDITGEDE